MPKHTINITVSIYDGLNVLPVHAHTGETLLDVLRRSGKPISAPCGGKGVCRKCAVDVSGTGLVLACQHHIDDDIEVKLSSASGFSILHTSHRIKSFKNDCGINITETNNTAVISYKGILIGETARSPSNQFGLAIDVGSTTIVLFLEDLNSYETLDVTSFVNPQTAYGGDVISRITFCIERADGLATLHNIVIDSLNIAIAELCQKNNIDAHEIYKTTIVGNTVMQHILFGADPRSIAFAPYTPVFVEEKVLAAKALNLGTHPNGIVKVLPSIAGYVGADIVAGLATTDMLERDSYTLYIDIGTNGEIALGNKDKIYCCATAAGPAFEGATISCGIGGVTGAISEFVDDEITTIGNAAPIGICGSGLIDIVATLLDNGLIDAMGYMENDFIIVRQTECAHHRDIVLTPHDVRKVQLAKSAIYAGIATLIKIAGVGYNQIERLYLAGGFGNYIRVESAIRIGLLPKELVKRIVPIGNAAGTGARFALKSTDFEKNIKRVLETSEYIELSMRQDFNDAYVAAMIFENSPPDL